MKRLIILLITAGCLGGCQNWLDLKPKNQMVVGKMEDVKAMMSSYLFALTASDSYSIQFNGSRMRCPFTRDAAATFTMYSDDIDMRYVLPVGGSYAKKYEKEYYEAIDWNSQIFSEQIWRDCYLHVGYMNSVLKSLGELIGDYEQSTFEKVKGEALVIRSFYLFKLLQLFAPYDNAELGIPMNLDPEIFEGTARLSQQKVYGQIIGDLTTALNYKTEGDAWNIFYTKDIIHSILAQVYMFKAGSAVAEESDWELAEEHADYIVRNYSLPSTPAEIAAVIRPGVAGVIKNKYVLLTLGWDITPRNNSYSWWGYPGYSGQVIDAKLLSLYDPDDYRLDLFFTELDNGMTTYNKYEYVTWKLSDYINLFRIEDIWLICAEANARLNRPKGKELLEEFKKTRIPGFTTYTGNDVLQEILLERRKEFCGDFDMRWLDMKRLNLEVTRMSLNATGETEVSFTLKAGDYRYAMRIPVDSELAFNKIPQNPGWN